MINPLPTGLAAFELLERMAEDLVAGAPIPLERAAWLRAALVRYRAGAPDGLHLDDALGLTAHGRDAWWIVAATRDRDDAIRECWRECFSALRPSAAAREILACAVRYEASQWRRDRDKPRDEASHWPAPRRYLFLALKSGRPMPRLRQLNEILGAGRNVKKCNFVAVKTARRSRDDDRGKIVGHERTAHASR